MDIEEVASQIVERLFVNWKGCKADRLAMKDIDEEELGGWCKHAVNRVVTKVLGEQTDLLKVLEDNKWDLMQARHEDYPGEWHVTQMRDGIGVTYTQLVGQGKTPTEAILNAMTM